MGKLKKYLPTIIIFILLIVGIIFWVNYQRKRQAAQNQNGNGANGGSGSSGGGSGQQHFEPVPTPSGGPAMDDPNVVADTELPNPPAGFAGLGVER